MRTTQLQYEIMVDFMETHGDLSKPSSGPRGRNFIAVKWHELANKLNSEGSGDPRSEEKWRKVWSDYKNNCKKKCAKINKAAGGTGGGPALQLTLTDLENRVMQLVGVQAATGMAVQEAGFYLTEVNGCHTGTANNLTAASEIDWNIPGSSSGPVVFPPHENTTPVSPSAPPPHSSTPPPIREMEVKERVRQRDIELYLQAQWLDFMKEAMNVFKKYVEKKE